MRCCVGGFGAGRPPLRTVADAFLTRDGWTYTAILEDQPGGSAARCVAFFAARNEAEVSATAINSVLYSRAAECDWTAVAWEAADPAEAVKYVKIMLSIDDDQDEKWGEVAKERIAAANFPDPPAGYDKGMFVSDPLYQVVRDDIDRDAIIETLEEWGFKVAKIAIESKSPDECYFRSELCRIAAMAEACGPLGPGRDGAGRDGFVVRGRGVRTAAGCATTPHPALRLRRVDVYAGLARAEDLPAVNAGMPGHFPLRHVPYRGSRVRMFIEKSVWSAERPHRVGLSV